MAESKDNVKVAIRVRPLSEKEKKESGAKTCISVQKEQCNVVIDARPDTKTFTFDYVADAEVPQDEIFERVGKPISASCLSGYNGTIFAYGQTGAGKTFTILGPENDGTMENYEKTEEFQRRGLMPRCIEHIFSSIAQEQRQNSEVEFLVKASFLEIYQEQVIDLLSSAGEGFNLQLREDIKRGVYVDGLIEENVSSIQDTYELLRTGTCNRHVGSTSMNKESSRSHSVFTLTIESKTIHDGVTNFRSSRFHMIDLAGSERQKSTDAIGERLREAGMINKSLSALGNVINSLVDIAEGKSRHVHYRDSKLTFLLKDSLGGNSRTFIVANISPSAVSFGETLSTLKFAQRAKMIKNKAVVNEDTAGSVQLLKEEIRRLKEEVSTMREATLLAVEQCPKCAGVMSEGGKFPFLEASSDRLLQLEALLERNTKLRIKDTRALEETLAGKDSLIKSLQTQIEKFEKKASNDKMVLKFRDATIAKLQGNAPGEDLELENARKEIAVLREQLEGTASAAKLYMENERLKEELRTLHREVMEDPDSLIVRMRESQEYTEQVVEWLNEDVSTRETVVSATREQIKAVYDEYLKLKSGEMVPETVCKAEELLELKLTYADRISELTEQLQNAEIAYSDLGESSGKRLEQQAKRIEDLVSDNAFLTRKCEELVSLHSAMEDQHSVSEVKRLMEEVSLLTDSVATAKVELEQERREKAQLAEKNSAMDSLLSSASEDLKFLETQQIALQTSHEALNRDLSHMKSAKAEDEKRIISLESDISTLQQTLETKLTEITSLSEELETAQDDNRFVKTELEEVRKTLEDLRDEKEELERCNEVLTLEAKEQEDAIGEMKDKFRRETEEVKGEIAARETENEGLEGDIKRVYEEVERLKAKIEELEREIADLKAVIAALQRDKTELTDETASLLSQLSSKETKIADKQTEIESQSAKSAEKSAEILSLRSQTAEKSAEILSLQSQIRDLQSENALLSSDILNFEQKIASLASVLEQKDSESQSEREIYEESLREKEGRVAELESELETIRRRIQETGVCTDIGGNSVVELVETLREKIAEEEVTAASAKSELESLRNYLQERNLHIESLESDLKSLQTDFTAAKNRCDAGEAHSSHLTSELSVSKATVDRLRAELKAADVHFTELETALQQGKSTIEDLEAGLAAEKQNSLRESSKLVTVERDRNAAERLVAELRGSISELKETIRDKDRLVTELENAHEAAVAGEKSTQLALLRSIEAEEALQEEVERYVGEILTVKSTLATKESECSRLSDALSTAIKDLETLRGNLQEAHTREKELQHTKAELVSQLQAWEEESKGQSAVVFSEKRKLEEKLEEVAKGMREKEVTYEEKTAKLAEHIGLQHKNIEQYQQLLAAAEKKAADFALELSQKTEASAVVTGLKSRVEDLEEALEGSQQEVKSLKEENRAKQEILQNTNRNILSTRQEIEMWKKCIEEKNDNIQQLRQNLRKSEEEKAILQSALRDGKGKSPCSHEGEIQYIKGVLERREKELFELKEKGQLYYAQADEAIEAQRKDLELLTKRCAIYQSELAKCKEELRTATSEDRRRYRSQENSAETGSAELMDRSPIQTHKSKPMLPKGKDEVLSLKAQLARLREDVCSKEEQLEGLKQLLRAKSRSRTDDESREQLENQVESLSAGLNKITEFVSGLPIVAFNPEETGIVESTIKAIASVYEAYEQKCRELQTKTRAHPTDAGKYSSEAHLPFGSNFVNPANYKSPVAHYHALLNSSSIKPGQLLSPGQERRSPLKFKKP